ncbi:cyclophilin-like fold protein [Sphingomonas sp. R1]|uniref:cyclophilin-like fold protein n=1 Tax=Sphingomonas sp. R1 TaxID=399176 RepID=UPI00222583F1|nr:cyclophilin-like fold protein [Sphingomonas sp. R1]UYY78500.1 cyclophilin-like fold protein [Sphingomonas sp. R1]
MKDPRMATRAVPHPASRLEIEGPDGRWHVQLEDSAATRDLLALMPLTLELEDFGVSEKIAMLPRRLRHPDAPEGVAPVAGDLAYYAPWGNLAIFRRDFRYSPGLVRLGRITTPLAALRGTGRLRVTLRQAPRDFGAPR